MIAQLKHLTILQYYLLLFSGFLLAQPAFCQEQIPDLELKPIPKWVKYYPIAKIKPSYDIDLVLVHYEKQFNHTTQEEYYRDIYYLNTLDGLNSIKKYYFIYEPDFQTIQIHQVNIHRDSVKMPLNEQLHIEYVLSGKNIGGKRYDDNGQIYFHFEKAQVGDLLEIVYTKKGIQPDVHNKLFYRAYLIYEKLRGKSYLRILTDKDNVVYYKTMNLEEKPKQEKNENYNIYELIINADKKPDYCNITDGYDNKELVYFTDVQSWEEITTMNLHNYKLEDTIANSIREKVKELTKNQEEKPDKINQVLNFVQEEIEYLNYGLIEPKRPETVLQQGFGDCKSMSLLTIKMLELLNVKAWAVLVDAYGMDSRMLDMPHQAAFNHCVVEFVYDGDTILFDPTFYPQIGTIYQKQTSYFGHGLRLIKGENKLSRLSWSYSDKIEVVTKSALYSPRIAYTEGLIYIHGDKANELNYFYQKNGITKLWRKHIRDIVKSFYCSISKENTLYEPDTLKQFSTLTYKLDDCGKYINYHKNLSKRLSFTPFFISEQLDLDSTVSDVGKIGIPDFNISYDVEIKVRKVKSAKLDTFSFKNDWIEVQKEVIIKDNTIYIKVHAKNLKRSLPASEYQRIKREAEKLKQKIITSIDKVKTFKYEAYRELKKQE